jgi:hypothetical protein
MTALRGWAAYVPEVPPGCSGSGRGFRQSARAADSWELDALSPAFIDGLIEQRPLAPDGDKFRWDGGRPMTAAPQFQAWIDKVKETDIDRIVRARNVKLACRAMPTVRRHRLILCSPWKAGFQSPRLSSQGPRRDRSCHVFGWLRLSSRGRDGHWRAAAGRYRNRPQAGPGASTAARQTGRRTCQRAGKARASRL